MWYYSFPVDQISERLPIYLYSMGLHDTQPLLFRPEGLSHDQFFYNTHGSGTIIIYGKKHLIPEKSCFFVPARVPHEYYPNTDVWDVRWFVPGGHGIKSLFEYLNIKFGIYPLKDASVLDSLLNKMRNELLYNDVKGNIFASAYIYEFIMEFAQQSGLIEKDFSIPEQKMTPYARHMKIMTDYIDTNYMQHISMEDLCALEGLTSQHICRIFKHCVRMRPSEYILNTRISHAKEMLIHTEHSISEISYWCGFDNDNYFFRTFKNITGSTPGSFRRLSRLNRH